MSMAAAAALMAVRQSPAAVYTYVGPDFDEWSNPSNWFDGTSYAVPAAGDDAIIDSAAPLTVFYNGSYSPGSGLDSVAITGDDADLSLGNATLAIDNTSFYGGLILGSTVGGGNSGQGEIDFVGTSVLDAGTNEEIGFNGTGIINQNGGTHNITGGYSAFLGRNEGDNGTYIISHGNFNVGSTAGPYGNLWVGYDGNGTVTQTGGTVAVSAGLMLAGDGVSSTGSYAISAGSLSADFIGVGGEVGEAGGTGTLNISGTASVAVTSNSGPNTAVGYLTIWPNSTVNLSGGTLTTGAMADDGLLNITGGSFTASSVEYVGYHSNGEIAQSGGTNTCENVYIGYQEGSSGSYSLSGTGSLSASETISVGIFGNGSFQQSGGSVTVDQLGVGADGYSNDGNEYNDGNGTYSMTGGSLLVNTIEGIGDVSTNGTGTGTFDQSGGTHTVDTEQLIVGKNGTYSLHGTGQLVVNNSGLDLGGTFLQSDSTSAAYLNGLFIGEDYVASYTLNDGLLHVNGEEDVGNSNSGSGTFTQNGGTNYVIGSVYIAPSPATIVNGTYNLNGGQLDITGNLVNDGTFNSNGGTLSVGGVISGTGIMNVNSGAVAITPNTVIDSGTVNFGGASVSTTSLTVTSANNADVTLTSSAGAVTLTGQWTVTTPTGSTGSVSVVTSGGTFYTDSAEFTGNTSWEITGDAAVTIGGGLSINNLSLNSGSETVNYSANPNDTDSQLYNAIVVGYQGAGASQTVTGTMSVSGTAIVTTPDLVLGIQGSTGNLNQTGGTITVTTLTVGDNVAANDPGAGSITVSGGVLNVTTVLLGSADGGSGAMTVSGTAQVNVGGGLNANDFTLMSGTVAVAADRVSTSEDSELHYAMVAGYEHNGAIHIAGGTLNTPILKLGIESGTTGTYSQTGGAVTVHDPIGSLPGGGVFAIGNDATGLGTGGGIGIANISGGTLLADSLMIGSTVGGSGTLTLSGSAQLTANKLAMASNGKIVLNGGSLVISYGTNPDPVATIRGYLISGYNGGKWNGPDIDSTTAAANHSYALGYADSADAGNPAGLSSHNIEIKYTLYGDTTLDGTVNSVDFGNLAANFGKSGKVWDQGDFDYNGTVNSIDFGLLAGNFGKSAGGGSVVTASDWSALYAFADANGLMSEVPEPASTSLAAATAVGVVSRRRRRLIGVVSAPSPKEGVSL
jgi:fibronectin-binding autotransporter adhesin